MKFLGLVGLGTCNSRQVFTTDQNPDLDLVSFSSLRDRRLLTQWIIYKSCERMFMKLCFKG